MTTTDFRRAFSAAKAVAKVQTSPWRPRAAMIEVADRCNEVCVHCYQVQGQKGEMSTEQVFSVMDQLAEMGILFLTLSGGEPTLRPDFMELVEHARELQFAVKIYTNGLRVDAPMAQRLAELAVQEVQISLYSPRSEVHDWVTRVPGSHQRTLAAARLLIEQGVRVVLKSPVMSFNSQDRGRYIELVEQIGAHYMLDAHIEPREDGSRDPEALRLDHGGELELKKDERIYGEREAEAALRPQALDRPVCGACINCVHVEANGELRPCAQLTHAVGHALDERGLARSLDEDTEGKMIRQLRFRDLHGCRDCALQPYCHRCYANALTHTGDALGPYAVACHGARIEYELVHRIAPRIAGPEGALGPYAALAEHEFRSIPDHTTAADERRYGQHPWLRQPAPLQAPTLGADGLVQIRRPGSRKAEPASPQAPGRRAQRIEPMAAK